MLLDDGSLKLRNGVSVWSGDAPSPRVPTFRLAAGEVLHTDIAIVGAGITGGFLAERFTRDGHAVAVLDRRAPASGSTTASTAMLLWELDSSLLALEERLGLARVARLIRMCRAEVARIGATVNVLDIACGFSPRASVYLAGDQLDAVQLREEQGLRTRLGIPGKWMGSDELASHGFNADAALWSPGAAEADPLRLALGLLAVAAQRGARVLSPVEAHAYETTLEGVTIETDAGAIVRARTLVLANGYELPEFVPTPRHTMASSWCVATEAMASPPWPADVMLWEASDPYLYLRRGPDNRIIIGGEDEDMIDSATREARTPDKVRTLLAKAAQRCPGLSGVRAEFAWSGVFGESDDSLPFIGPVPGKPNCLAAFGYGGNGITFSALAADILAADLNGQPQGDAQLFGLDRDS